SWRTARRARSSSRPASPRAPPEKRSSPRRHGGHGEEEKSDDRQIAQILADQESVIRDGIRMKPLQMCPIADLFASTISASLCPTPCRSGSRSGCAAGRGRGG